MSTSYRYLPIVILISCLSCNPPSGPTSKLEPGIWRMEMHVDANNVLPFNFEIRQEGDTYDMIVHNDTERLRMEKVEFMDDSLRIRMPFFDAEFLGKIESPTRFSGNWYDYSRGDDYHMPFVANQGEDFRFEKNPSAPSADLAPAWEVTFSPHSDTAYPAIGRFEQNGNMVTGTFLTETGDYRFLEGSFQGNRLLLSAFDGSHAFLFDAELQENGQLSGTFYSGVHWVEPWTAIPNEHAQLTNPDSLTFLKEGYETLAFSFPNLEGETISLTDDRYQNKVVIVQLMGSWCPNCMDETRLFAQWYDTYQAQGLEIIGLAFERVRGDRQQAITSISRMKKRLGVNYEILLAASDHSKTVAGEALPMLNKVMSFPTSIFIDRQGRIRKIHTGFNGPGTGDVYLRFVEEYTYFLEKLLKP